MTDLPLRLRKTLRLMLLGAAAGVATSLASVFTVFALAGQPGAIIVPIVWEIAAMIGVVSGSIVLPILAGWLLREVPVRRIMIVSGCATWAGSAVISVIGHGGLGAIVGLIAAVVWLRYLEPALGPVTVWAG